MPTIHRLANRPCPGLATRLCSGGRRDDRGGRDGRRGRRDAPPWERGPPYIF